MNKGVRGFRVEWLDVLVCHAWGSVSAISLFLPYIVPLLDVTTEFSDE